MEIIFIAVHTVLTVYCSVQWRRWRKIAEAQSLKIEEGEKVALGVAQYAASLEDTLFMCARHIKMLSDSADTKVREGDKEILN